MTPDNLYNLADDTPPTATMDLASPDLEAAKYLAMVQSWPQILAKSGEDRLDTPDRVEIVQQIAVVSQSEVAWQRGHEIALLAKRRAPEPLRLVTMAVAALFSGLVVGGSAMQALEGRNALAVGWGVWRQGARRWRPTWGHPATLSTARCSIIPSNFWLNWKISGPSP